MFIRVTLAIWALRRASRRAYLGPILRPFWARPGPEALDFMVPQAGLGPGASQEGPKGPSQRPQIGPKKGLFWGPF